MVVNAEGDVAPLLRVWDTAPEPASSIHIAVARLKMSWEGERRFITSVFLEDYPEAADRIGEFLTRPQVDKRIEKEFFKVEDPILQTILSNGAD